MKKYRLISQSLILLLSLSTYSKPAQLQDVPYVFDQQKNQAAADSFHFLRSYVDYFYLLIHQNQSQLKVFNQFQKITGTCVGDAHAENFGLLIQKDQTSQFTMNDMDDSGPCPVTYDLYRLLSSSRLYNKDIKIDALVSSYRDGLKNKSIQVPKSIQKMITESQKKGATVNPKKIVNNLIVRDSSLQEISSDEFKIIDTELHKLQLGLDSNFKILDIVSTHKVGGGSGGLLRYEVLVSSKNQLIQVELKEEVKPSLYPVATGSIDNLQKRLSAAILAEQKNPFLIYSSVVINSKNMLIRPRFHGNIGVTLSDNSIQDNLEIINYEAYTLGQIHSRSVKDLDLYQKMIKSVSSKDLESDVQLMTDLFKTKFKQVKTGN